MKKDLSPLIPKLLSLLEIPHFKYEDCMVDLLYDINKCSKVRTYLRSRVCKKCRRKINTINSRTTCPCNRMVQCN